VKYSKVIALSLAILAIGVTIYYYITNNPTEITQSPNQYILNTQINSEGLVTIEVTPKNLSESAETWDFEIVLDTHSGNLEQDLTETSILIDDKGNKFNPISWEGDPPQGHHRSGVLKFKPISQRLKLIELKINQVGDIGERSFRWELR